MTSLKGEQNMKPSSTNNGVVSNLVRAINAGTRLSAANKIACKNGPSAATKVWRGFSGAVPTEANLRL